MTTEYTYKMPWGEKVKIRANLSDAGAPILVRGEDAWVTTPYRTADARHKEREMLRLVLRWESRGDSGIDEDAADEAISLPNEDEGR
jgi:hypothetical protein